MRKLVWILVLYSVFAFCLSVNAAFTWINANSWDGWDKCLEGSGGILDALYGWDNLTRIADSPYPGNQIWMNLNGGATAEAKYAAYSQVFGYIAGLAAARSCPCSQ